MADAIEDKTSNQSSVEDILARRNVLINERSSFMTLLGKVAKYVMPEKDQDSFNSTGNATINANRQTKGNENAGSRTDVEGKAILHNDGKNVGQVAASHQKRLVIDEKRNWHSLAAVKLPKDTDADFEKKQKYYDALTRIGFDFIFNEPSSAFSTAISQMFLEVVHFSTCAISADRTKGGDSPVVYKAYSITDFVFRRAYDDRIIEFHLTQGYSPASLKTKFGEENLHEEVIELLENTKDKHSRTINVSLSIEENPDWKGNKKDERRYIGRYIDVDNKKEMGQETYNVMPFVVFSGPRIAGNTYGSSASIAAYPYLALLNSNIHDYLDYKDMMLNPPVEVDGEFLTKNSDFALGPGVTVPRASDRQGPAIDLLQLNADARPTEGWMNRLERKINEAYGLHMMHQMDKSNMSATEVSIQQDREIAGTLSSVGEIQRGLTDLIRLTYDRLNNMASANEIDYLPEPVPNNERYKIEFHSGLTDRINQSKAATLHNEMMMNANMVQIFPEVVDLYDFPKALKQHSNLSGTSLYDLWANAKKTKSILEQRKTKEAAQEAIQVAGAAANIENQTQG